MASVYSANMAIEELGTGDAVGTWSVNTNSNWSITDQGFGTAASISLAGGSVTLSTAQTRSAHLIFTGALPASVNVTIPSLSSSPGTTISGRYFTVQNLCTNSSLYTVTLKSTVSGMQSICIPPITATDVILEGTGGSSVGSVKFRNLGPIGTFWDYAGSSVPAWVSVSTVPPYLLCDGTTFSSATYPQLALVLGGTTLPDARGRTRFSLNSGTGRITAGSGGLDGDTNLSGGGAQATTLSSANIPPVPINDPTHQHFSVSGGAASGGIAGGNYIAAVGATYVLQGTTAAGPSAGLTSLAATGITAGNGSPTAFPAIPPGYVGGITMIRAG